jgi:hypothetical protein
MPHAMILGATRLPPLGPAPLATGATVHKVLEMATHEKGWLLKSLVIGPEGPIRFLTRVDRHDNGLLVRLDDHMAVDRTSAVFDPLALIAQRILAADPEGRLGQTNLGERISRLAALPNAGVPAG